MWDGFMGKRPNSALSSGMPCVSRRWDMFKCRTCMNVDAGWAWHDEPIRRIARSS
jgi:hypothetical protein